MFCIFPIKGNNPRPNQSGFTLVELLLATTILTVILGLFMGVFGQVSDVWQRSSQKVKAFQSARVGFDVMTRNLGQATLNTFLDYMDASNRFPSDPAYNNLPVRYARNSHLHFMSGRAGQGDMPGTANTGTAVFFQVPVGFCGGNEAFNGLDRALNACGYFVEFGRDVSQPSFITAEGRPRYRLKQFFVPMQDNEIYADATSDTDWFTDDVTQRSHVVAENIIAIICQPQDPADIGGAASFGLDYNYNSRQDQFADPQPVTANQLPPVMQVTMIAIDESSAQRLESGDDEPQVIKDALNGRFQNAVDLQDDLEGLKLQLGAARINYHVFTSTVPVRESKWSK